MNVKPTRHYNGRLTDEQLRRLDNQDLVYLSERVEKMSEGWSREPTAYLKTLLGRMPNPTNDREAILLDLLDEAISLFGGPCKKPCGHDDCKDWRAFSEKVEHVRN